MLLAVVAGIVVVEPVAGEGVACSKVKLSQVCACNSAGGSSSKLSNKSAKRFNTAPRQIRRHSRPGSPDTHSHRHKACRPETRTLHIAARRRIRGSAK